MNTQTIRPVLSHADSLADLQGRPRTLSYRVRRALLLPLLALVFMLAGTARAEDADPNVEAANNANVAFVQCLNGVLAAAEKIATESTRVMMIEGAPEKCARNVRSPIINKEPSAASRGWAFAQFLVGAIAQYKGQALVWGALQAMVGRQADSTDNAVNQGFNTANTSIGTVGNLAGQAQALIPAPEPVPATTTP